MMPILFNEVQLGHFEFEFNGIKNSYFLSFNNYRVFLFCCFYFRISLDDQKYIETR